MKFHHNLKNVKKFELIDIISIYFQKSTGCAI